MKKVLITGASGGIGKSIAECFYEKGYFVILCGRNESKIKEITKSWKNNYAIFTFDLSQKNKINEFCNQVTKSHENVDILINNAGITDDNLFLRMKYDQWVKVLDINLNSNFLITNFFIKQMLKKKWGRVINITSVVGHSGNAGQTNYCASKSAIIGMSKSLALEVAKRGITINCISPGFIQTSMTESLNEQQQDAIIKSIPVGKVGQPEDIAGCALFLASECSSYITGQTFHVNGGLLMV